MVGSPVFQVAVRGVFAREGGYVYDASDPGGETNRGISKRQYPSVDIAMLTDETAAVILHRDYWQPLSCDSLPAIVAAKLFDTAVNCGPQQAVLILQHAANDLGGSLKQDGVLGPITRAWVMGANKTALVCAMAAVQTIEAPDNALNANLAIQWLWYAVHSVLDPLGQDGWSVYGAALLRQATIACIQALG